MSKDLQLVVNNDLGPVPGKLAKRDVDISAFTSGLQPSFPTINVKGGRWGVRFGGETTQFTEADPRAGGAQTPVTFLDVIIVMGQSGISKSYYDGGYVEGNNEPPICWSADGQYPDKSVEQKQNPNCGSCPKNIRGSKVIDGKKLKACTDIKRLAVVRQAEIDNPLGPILLRVTPGSQSNLRTYMQWLVGRRRAPFTVVTRMTFDTEAPFPKIKFRAERGVDDQEAEQIDAVLDHPMLNTIVNGKDVMAFAADTQQEEEDAAGGLPPTGGLPPATSKWSQPAPEVTPPSKTAAEAQAERVANTHTAEKDRIKALEAQLAAAQKANEPEPEPEPEPVLTPEQLKIRELEAQLAAAKAPKKPGRPRSTPVGPPTQTGNGTVSAEKPASELDNQISDRIARAAGKVQP